jgi:HlyD family secretion protein
MKKAILTLLVLAVLSASGYAYYRYRNTTPAPVVTTSPVTRGDVTDQVGATGTLQAVTTVQVGTQVSGTIQALYADFNSLVQKGQVLARLDPSLFQTQIEQARANLLRAQADVERLRVGLDDSRTKAQRARELSARQLLPRSEMDAAEVAVRSSEAQVKSAEAQVVQAQASLNQNQVNLQHTVIEAPIDGLVISRNVDVGQTVAASMQAPTLFVLAADLTKMQVLANLDESDVGRIRPGQRVTFRVDAYPAEDFVGTVAQVRLQPIVQQNVVTYATVIDVPNPALKLKPGMTANVTVEIARQTNVLRIPNTALRFRPTNDIFAALGQPPVPAGRGGAQSAPGGAPGSATAPSLRDPSLSSTPAAAPVRPAAPAPTARPAPAPVIAARVPTAEAPDREAAPARATRSGGSARARANGESRPDFPARGNGRGTGRGRGLRRSFEEGATSRPRETVEPAGRAEPSAAPKSATTIDALFGPLPPVESTGRVWTYVDGRLAPRRVRLGITDGQATELLEGEELQEGTELVTNISTGTATARPTPTGSGFSPFMGQQPGRGGGFGGGGAGGNRGGGR